MKFQIGDRVYAPFHKYGTVVEIDGTDKSYPITVKWDESRYKIGIDLSTFSEDGYLFISDKTENTKITKVEDEKMDAEDEMFHVGDHVWSPHFGAGVVTRVEGAGKDDEYPIEVHWGDDRNDYDYFAKDGKYDTSGANPDMAIYSLDPEHAEMVLPNIFEELAEEDESTVERMEDALNKKVDDAVNPAHYKVEGLPEAIDIINHLMHREQYEGFLWGNILKYVYRFGRKGDKAETAGKIEWYAKQLKELEEEHK